MVNNAGSACTASLKSTDDAKIATMHIIVPKDYEHAIVLAAIKGKALTRQLDGRP